MQHVIIWNAIKSSFTTEESCEKVKHSRTCNKSAVQSKIDSHPKCCISANRIGGFWFLGPKTTTYKCKRLIS